MSTPTSSNTSSTRQHTARDNPLDNSVPTQNQQTTKPVELDRKQVEKQPPALSDPDDPAA